MLIPHVDWLWGQQVLSWAIVRVRSRAGGQGGEVEGELVD